MRGVHHDAKILCLSFVLDTTSEGPHSLFVLIETFCPNKDKIYLTVMTFRFLSLFFAY